MKQVLFLIGSCLAEDLYISDWYINAKKDDIIPSECIEVNKT